MLFFVENRTSGAIFSLWRLRFAAFELPNIFFLEAVGSLHGGDFINLAPSKVRREVAVLGIVCWWCRGICSAGSLFFQTVRRLILGVFISKLQLVAMEIAVVCVCPLCDGIPNWANVQSSGSLG